MSSTTGLGLQFTSFLVVGVLNTLVDFGIYNLLARPPLRWPRIAANCVSVTVAITFSFIANFFFVFRPEEAHLPERGWKFLLVTMFSAYVIQNLVIHLLSRTWPWPVELICRASRCLILTRRFEEDFVRRNTVKLFAVATGLIWNFLWYRYCVFAA